jgi:SAM-dependent methyltransferase
MSDTGDADRAVRESRRWSFDAVADLYDRVRPDYPTEAIEDLVQLAGIDSRARVLEIGAGTGQLTLELAKRGCEIVAVELGPRLAAIASRRLGSFPKVSVVNAAFEDWPLPSQPFDTVVAATSFHWLDPAVRVTRAADCLRTGGALAIVSTEHVAGGTDAFFAAAQSCYERWDASTPVGLRLQPADDIPVDTEEISRTGRFGDVTTRRYVRGITYTTNGYLDVLRTYSGHQALSADDLRGLLECIGALIDGDYGGRVTKAYLTQTLVARRS